MAEFDVNVPSIARVYDYWLGGVPLHYYSAEAIDALFTDLELVPPGVTETRAWGVTPATLPPIAERIGDMVSDVARVPAR